MFALPEKTAQGVRNLFCIAQQIGETPALRRDGRSIDKRGSRSPFTRRMPQGVANRHFKHRLRPITGAMRDCFAVVSSQP
jgi:hypothetical protein